MYAFRPAPVTAARHLVCLDLVQSATQSEGQDHPGLIRRIETCRRLLMHARMREWEITHVHPRSAAKATRPVQGLEPLPSERLVYRTGLSAFSNRPFCEAIEAQPDAEVILLSFSVSSSCLVTALTAHDWGLSVVLASDAALGAKPDRHGRIKAEASAQAIVSPFVRVAAADELIEVRRGLRLVVDTAQAVHA